ncbi:MAG: polysaccharide biosynthesis tyrosine autokinase [Deferrisomatales bacterium]|nr:polysaccharide biosynthesis tyrosine autokinase [Deferrisomatales bacterium]
MSKIRKALDKAFDSPGAGDDAFFPAGREPVLSVGKRAGPLRELREAINPVYTRTRVEKVDPEVLIRNKIACLAHDGQIPAQVKILRTQIEQKMQDVGGRSLLITSSIPGEGKTFTAVNLAVSFAQVVNRTVLLVDADLRKPSIHRLMGVDSCLGLSDYLLQQAEIPDVLFNPGVERLTLLPAGTRVPNSTELLGSPRMEALVSELKDRYPERFIIFDASALLVTADPLVFTRYIDGILLVVEAERTPKADIQRSIKLLEGKPFMGMVYNKAPGGE